jgi:hypothetical protein
MSTQKVKSVIFSDGVRRTLRYLQNKFTRKPKQRSSSRRANQTPINNRPLIVENVSKWDAMTARIAKLEAKTKILETENLNLKDANLNLKDANTELVKKEKLGWQHHEICVAQHKKEIAELPVEYKAQIDELSEEKTKVLRQNASHLDTIKALMENINHLKAEKELQPPNTAQTTPTDVMAKLGNITRLIETQKLTGTIRDLERKLQNAIIAYNKLFKSIQENIFAELSSLLLNNKIDREIYDTIYTKVGELSAQTEQIAKEFSPNK